MTIEKRNTSFLEAMFEDFSDIYSDGTDTEVERQLNSLGVDLKQIKQRFSNTIEQCRLQQKRRLLDVAKRERQNRVSIVSKKLAEIKSLNLSVPELIKKIAVWQPAMAHRDFQQWSKEDLESQLADLMASEQDEQ